MSDLNSVRIGKQIVDINDPAAVAAALRRVQLQVVAGDKRETVRIDGEEVTFTRANSEQLERLIKFYEDRASKVSGKRRRFAMGLRY
ncbi:hypothetical protein J7363_04015 [Phaeobacter italicus]|uniref:Uncharacterized protein n=1 Tax=Phaeobacter italicus TaxID=481446 RepID=A0A0H5CXL7_9RHOB|nr:gpW family head-tail joining protein [Phaeobacter italicus]MBO9441248.1 hypothetical protein [Phaeobacter italicus]NKX42653.1 hypothetical protein [Rhodobacteraceae bacterium R_SAG2]CRL09742.1 hypothetical protein NIT7321_00576 [Phaeobacter italicus]